jgi:hypothetical protein
MARLWDALAQAYRALGFDGATGGDEVFRQLVLASIIEPTSKLDSARVLEETGISAPSYRTLPRRLPIYAKESWRQKLAAACGGHAGLGPASLVLTTCPRCISSPMPGMGFREPGFCNKAETKTMLPGGPVVHGCPPAARRHGRG